MEKKNKIKFYFFLIFFFLKPDRFFDGIIVRCYCTGLDHIKDQSLHASGNTSIFRRDSRKHMNAYNLTSAFMIHNLCHLASTDFFENH